MANHWRETGDFYVSSLDGDDTSGDGSIENPVKTISKAILLVNAAATNSQTIVVGTGVYAEGLVASSSPLNTSIIGDGVVILTGEGSGVALSGYPSEWHIKNIHVVNFAALLSVSTNSGPQWFNCTFKGIPTTTLVSITSSSYVGRRHVWYNCMFVGMNMNSTSVYARNLHFYSCTFINSNIIGQSLAGGGSGNNYWPLFSNCLFSAPSGSVAISSNQIVNTFFNNCVFQDNLRLQDSGTGIEESMEFFDRYKFYINNAITASMSFNTNITASGDFNLLSHTMPINETTSALYKRTEAAPLQGQGGYAPRTAYGFDNSPSNPLHTAGGAIWDNIVTSSLGGFQISSSSTPSGSITTAVIDQGGVKVIKNIDSGWTTNFGNATAPSTYPSGSNNYNPVRYQYEMRYGNTTPILGNYSIFEWGQIPFVNSNGTGSGDQLFNTGSYNSISARYLQLKITLRSDLSGSI